MTEITRSVRVTAKDGYMTVKEFMAAIISEQIPADAKIKAFTHLNGCVKVVVFNVVYSPTVDDSQVHPFMD